MEIYGQTVSVSAHTRERLARVLNFFFLWQMLPLNLFVASVFSANLLRHFQCLSVLWHFQCLSVVAMLSNLFTQLLLCWLGTMCASRHHLVHNHPNHILCSVMQRSAFYWTEPFSLLNHIVRKLVTSFRGLVRNGTLSCNTWKVSALIAKQGLSDSKNDQLVLSLIGIYQKYF